MCQRPGQGERHVADMPVAVSAQHAGRSIGSMPRSGRLRVSVASLAAAGCRRRSSTAAQSCSSPPCPAKPAPGTSRSRCGCGPRAAPSGTKRARRRREAPAGDDARECPRPARIRARSSAIAAVWHLASRTNVGVSRKRFSAASAEQDSDEAELDRKNDAVSGRHQRAKAFELDDRQRQARSAPGRRPPAPRRAKSGAATRSGARFRATAQRNQRRQRAEPIGHADAVQEHRRPGQPLRRSGRGVTARRQRQGPTPTIAIADSSARRCASTPHRQAIQADRRRSRDQQRRSEAGARARSATAPTVDDARDSGSSSTSRPCRPSEATALTRPTISAP